MLKRFTNYKRVFIMVFTLLFTLGIMLTVPVSAVGYTNPLIIQRADPHIYKHTDGYYYFTGSVPEYDRIILRRATTIQGLSTASETTIWWKHSSGQMGAHIWAPELHYIDGKWYIYFAAGEAEHIWAIRIYVLECSSADPITGTWIERGQLQPAQNLFSLDSTTFENNGTRYLVWAMQDPASNYESCLWIASMSNPWTLGSTPVRISKPDYSWERAGIPVNEGPSVLKRNGKIFISYSAADTSANYCMGLLTASDTSNLLSSSSWSKNSTPMMQSSDATGQYGPGHNSFTKSEDGTQDIIVYHARPYKYISGDPLYDPNRHARVQTITWNSDGTPNFGIPVADSAIADPVSTSRIQSYNFTDRYVRQYNYDISIDTNVNPIEDSEWNIVPGLACAGSGYVSFESVSLPGYYLRHYNYDFMLAQYDNTGVFAQDATFKKVAGLANSSWTSFQSYNFPNRYIRHSNYMLRIDPISTDTDKQDATFNIVAGTTLSSYVQIRNRATNINIDGYGYTTNGSDCKQYSDNPSYNQQWVIEADGSYVKIKNRATGLYLDGMGRTTNGSIAGQWSSSTSNNQKWIKEAVGSYVKFKNVATNLYLDGMGRSSNGSDLGQWSSSSSYNQQWYLEIP